MLRYRTRTLKRVVESSSSLLHLSQKVDFFSLAGMPSRGEPISLELRGEDVRVRWAEKETLVP